MKEYEAKLSAVGKEAEGILAAAKERAQRLMEENEQRLTPRRSGSRVMRPVRSSKSAEKRYKTSGPRRLNSPYGGGKSRSAELNDADTRRLADEASDALAKSSTRSGFERADQPKRFRPR